MLDCVNIRAVGGTHPILFRGTHHGAQIAISCFALWLCNLHLSSILISSDKVQKEKDQEEEERPRRKTKRIDDRRHGPLSASLLCLIAASKPFSSHGFSYSSRYPATHHLLATMGAWFSCLIRSSCQAFADTINSCMERLQPYLLPIIEKNIVPDFILRWGIRRSLEDRLASLRAKSIVDQVSTVGCLGIGERLGLLLSKLPTLRRKRIS